MHSLFPSALTHEGRGSEGLDSEAEPPAGGSVRVTALFASASFLSATLLFLLQPIAGKALLPAFGGSPATWITCMLFFQASLFGGYLYAHLLSRSLSQSMQRLVHALALLLACLLLPINPARGGGLIQVPEWAVLGSLAAGVGIPYLVLSASAPLLQRWYSARFPSRTPYRLYALGNVGSLLGLLVFPFALEPLVGARALALLWSSGFVLAAALLLACASIRAGPPPVACRSSDAGADRENATPAHDRVLWWLLPCAGSIVLLAITSHLSQDIAAVPLLWILPLAVYLLTYILAFHSPRWYSRQVSLWLLGIVTLVLTIVRGSKAEIHPAVLIAIYCAVVFLCCMVCHGELIRTRPHPRHLTAFYLGCAGGGALGGLFVSIVAPKLFDVYVELPVGVYLAIMLAFVGALRERAWTIVGVRLSPSVILPLVAVIVGVAGWLSAGIPGPGLVSQRRNFFGVTRVVVHEHDGTDRHLVLYHGSTIHGMQNLAEAKRTQPTSYYGPESGVGLVLSETRPVEPNAGRRIGVIGLGAGILAAYGRPGDTMRFYEIDANMIEVARRHFDFLRRSAAAIETIQGDARVRLAAEAPQSFDVLVLDAFSGDAIPVHLLTLEAFRLYLRHLRADGILVVHISNRYLDLAPVVWRIAEELHLERALIRAPSNHRTLVSASVYALLTPSTGRLQTAAIRSRDEGSSLDGRSVSLWTDDYSNLLAALD